VAVDRASTGTDDGVETVDKQQTAEAPPPPPDRPGAEGTPSRADSRAAAAAPVDNSPQQPRDKEQGPTTEDKSNTFAASEQSELDGQQSGTSDAPSETDNEALDITGSNSPADRDVQDETPADIPDADRQQTYDGETPLRDEAGTAGTEGGNTDRQLVPGESPQVDDSTVDKAPEPANAPAETADQRAADEGIGTDPADVPVESAEEQRAQDLQPQADRPQTEESPSPTDNGASPTATEQPDNTPDTESTDQTSAQTPDAWQAPESAAEAPDDSTDAAVPPDSAEKHADDASGIPEPPETAEDRTQIADEPPQRDRLDGASPSGEVVSDDTTETGEPAERADDPGQPAETDEAAPDNEVAPVGDTDTPDQEATADDARPDEEHDTQAADAALQELLFRHSTEASEDRELLFEYSEGETPVSGFLERTADRPTGEELVKMESDKKSRFERARKRGYERSEDVIDAVDKGADTVQKVLARPSPTGHPETVTHPEITPAPHEGISAGNAATAILVLGLMFGEGIRWSHGRMKQRERYSNAGN
jgi:hypothetical protein